MFEHHTAPLLPRAKFFARFARHAVLGAGLMLGSLGIGIAGYHLLEGQAYVDALLNASMLLGGMGPVGELHTSAGKIFASLYALFSGTVFLVVVGVVFAPVIHRALHRFHLESEDDQEKEDQTVGEKG